MSATRPTAHTGAEADKGARRSFGETKAAYKTTEFMVYVVAVLAVIVTSAMVDGDDGRGDYFRADEAMLYIVVLTVGYMISRGLAKAGARQKDDTVWRA